MRGFIVPHSHWDREWYLTFQQFRFKLVQLVDQVLDILEQDPQFKYFTLDGQTVILEDYLEIKPEERRRIERLIREGRLLIGPWYVLPDEFLVSGEALIRNLQKGLALSSLFGGGMAVGYIPDMFGHIAQMPQILQGFGIDTAVLWRGVGGECRDTQFIWEAPDGSQVETYYLIDTYSNAAGLPAEAEELARQVAGLIENQRPFLSTDAILLMNGSDHLMAQPHLPEILVEAGASAGVQLEISTLPLYIEHMRRSSPRFSHLKGELRSGERAPLLVSCASSRLYQKQKVHELETLLEKYAEPFAGLASLQGHPYPRNFLQESWRLLLLSHPHDSICGCSNDQVHREIETRLDQGLQIATLIREESLDRLAGEIDTSALPEGPAVVVFNPHPFPADFPVEVELPATGGGSLTHLVDEKGEAVPWQRLSDDSGEYINITGTPLQARMALGLVRGGEFQGLHLNDYRISGPDEKGLLRADLIMGRAPTGEIDIEKLKGEALEILADKRVKKVHAVVRQSSERGFFLARNVPGCGWRCYAPAAEQQAVASPLDLKVSRRSLENSFYRIKFNSDGTLDLLDRASGKELPGLHRLVDGGDRGDLYTYTKPEEDRPVEKPLRFPKGVKYEVVESGPVRATVRLTQTYRLPVSLAADRRKRARQKVDCQIVTEVSLIAGVPGIHFKTVIDNCAKDHRLRVHFRAPFPARECQADGQFAVLRRPVQPPEGDYSGWAEVPDGLAPQRQFVAIDNGEFGIAVINRGLPEYEVLPGDGSAEIALTLLRAVGWLSRGDLANKPGHAGPAVETPEGQCPGEQTAYYTLLPYRGRCSESGVKALAGVINAPPCAVVAERASGGFPASRSMLTIEPENMVLSCFKRAEEGAAVIIRFYNCSGESCEAVVKPGFTYKQVCRADFLEQPSGAPLESPDGTVCIPLRPWQIATLRFDI